MSAKRSLQERAQSHIDRRTDLAFDVCAEHSQIFDNVKHMRWFLLAVMDELKTYEPKRKTE